jgi:hypothetical protein
VIVRFIFWIETATPAFMLTRPAPMLAFRLMSAWRLSTSSSMRPTERVGTLSRTSGGEEVPETGAIVVVGELARGEEVMGVEEVKGGFVEVVVLATVVVVEVVIGLGRAAAAAEVFMEREGGVRARRRRVMKRERNIFGG